jgi:anti-sigma regulatory factor (Ser/Thr protein kinase)
MGDVVGHGIEAASLMGELRNAVRAYALEGQSPGEVLMKLNRLLTQMEGYQMATLLYAVIDADWTTLRFAAAGHPPPLVLGPGGRAHYLWEGRSPPIGAFGSAPYQEATAKLEPGTTLALYTDGLVEVRGENLNTGLDRLSEAARTGPEDPEGLCRHVIDALLGNRTASDDVAFMAFRILPLAPDRLHLELPTDRTSLTYARRLIARWLERAGASTAEAFDIQLASHEACANAIEHAYQFGDALVELEGRRTDGEVAVTVRDSGPWREKARSERGQGIELMRALMDEVRVNGGPDGTEIELRRRLRGS